MAIEEKKGNCIEIVAYCSGTTTEGKRTSYSFCNRIDPDGWKIVSKAM